MSISIHKRPYEDSVTATVPASGTQDIVITVPEPILLKSINITLGATTTLNSVKIDNQVIESATNIDFVSKYGDLVYVQSKVIINVTNGNTTAGEDTTLSVKGIIYH